jgi:hypothetical protein
MKFTEWGIEIDGINDSAIGKDRIDRPNLNSQFAD